MTSKTPRVPIIGMALFSMFFGSGNLIFPLSTGQFGEGNFPFSMLGFLLTGVLVPFLGVITMVIYEGDYTRFFSCLGKKGGFLFTLILLTVWIPLGSGPRCITLCFANIKSYLPHPVLWSFSLGYTFLMVLLTIKKSRIFDILGYILTPLLLLCLSVIVFRGMAGSAGLPPPTHSATLAVKDGLFEGYNTMDLIASFFFSSTIIAALRRAFHQRENAPCPLGVALKSCLFGVFILGSVYIGLIGLAAFNASILAGIPKDELLAHLTMVLLGPKMRFLATSAVVLACCTTSIALLLVYSDYLRDKIFNKKISYSTAVLITSTVTYGMSILGFEGITRLTQPILQVFYPALIILMIISLIRHASRAKTQMATL